jgi:hypothetical protein
MSSIERSRGCDVRARIARSLALCAGQCPLCFSISRIHAMKSVKGPAFTAGKAGPAGKTSPAVVPAVDQQSEDIASLLRNFDHHSVRRGAARRALCGGRKA